MEIKDISGEGCTNCIDPATYEIVMVDVMGGVCKLPYCDEHIRDITAWILCSNDESFAGPGGVCESFTVKLLDGDRYRQMVAELN